MIGSGQPTERRVASSSTRISTLPSTTSMVVGLPTRKARSSSGISGTCATATTAPTASAQSSSGMPSGRSRLARRRLVVAALREREDEEDQAEHEGQVDAAMHRLLQEPEAGRVVVEERERRRAARRRAGRRAAPAAGSGSRSRTSPRARGPWPRRVPASPSCGCQSETLSRLRDRPSPLRRTG